MIKKEITRRRFIEDSTALTGTIFLPSNLFHTTEKNTKRTATDQVVLGKTGLKLSRLGMGTGSLGGKVQRDLGREGFIRLVKYAYDHGITYFDTADAYKTHELISSAIKGLPREKLFIQTKLPGNSKKPLESIDRYRKELKVDYIDSILTHCAVTGSWDEERKRSLEALEKAKEKGIIRAHGVSCHSLPALTKAANLNWVDVNLVRINPQGAWIDTPVQKWNAKSNASFLPAVIKQVKKMRIKKHGIIGMKIIGNGDFTKPSDREKSINFAMKCGLLNAIVIGFKSPAEIDEAISRMNRALST